MAFSELFPQAPIWIAVAPLAMVFGLAHLYRGWRGVGMTALLGAGLVLVADRRRVPEAAA